MTEHNVVNPQMIDAFVRKFVTRTRPEAGKAWFQKKLRSFIMNDSLYLVPLYSDDLAVMKNLPDYVKAAAERGEEIYDFQPDNPDYAGVINDLTRSASHIVDWFNALAAVAARNPTNPVEIEDQKLAAKWLQKLDKIPAKGISEIADEWFSHMGTRIKSEKDGVEIVMSWPDGYYAVRYTDLNTMKTDGRELQNCLQSGTYWDSVVSGRGAVYAIRKPNDEAVVGIRVLNDTLVECKGKNNKPVVQAYIQYVIDFLTKMGWELDSNQDLINAGIEIHDGKIGRFEDVADLVYDRDDLKIWQTAGKFKANTPDGHITGLIGGGRILSIQDGRPPYTLKVLNILRHPPSRQLAIALAKDDIFFYEGRYGGAKKIGKKLFSVDHYEGYEVASVYNDSNATDSNMVFIYSDSGAKRIPGHLLIDNGKLASINYNLFGFEVLFVKILNAMAFPPANIKVEDELAQFNIYFDKKKYGSLEQLAKHEFDVGMLRVDRLGARKMWIINVRGRNLRQRFWMSGNTLKRSAAVGNFDTGDNLGYDGDDIKLYLGKALQRLVLKKKVNKVEDAERFGMLNTPKGVVADFQSLIAAVPPDAAYANPYDDGVGDKILELAINEYGRDLSSDDQKKLYEAFKYKGQNLILKVNETSRIYDIDVPEVSIFFPVANSILVKKSVIKDKSLIAQVEKDCLASLKAAEKAISSYEYAHIMRTKYEFISKKVEAASDLLGRMIQNVNDETKMAIQERKANPDKYANDLSGRFAALNAFKKKYR